MAEKFTFKLVPRPPESMYDIGGPAYTVEGYPGTIICASGVCEHFGTDTRPVLVTISKSPFPGSRVVYVVSLVAKGVDVSPLAIEFKYAADGGSCLRISPARYRDFMFFGIRKLLFNTLGPVTHFHIKGEIL